MLILLIDADHHSERLPNLEEQHLYISSDPIQQQLPINHSLQHPTQLVQAFITCTDVYLSDDLGRSICIKLHILITLDELDEPIQNALTY
jgi:hypothetical protein